LFERQAIIGVQGLPLITRILNPKSILFSIAVPLLVLIVYCAVFLIICQIFELLGVNFHFVTNLLRLTLILFAVSVIVLVSLLIIKKIPLDSLRFDYRIQKVNAGSLGLVLLPLLPIVQYLTTNREILTVFNAVVILGAFLLFCIFLVLLIPSFSGRPDTSLTLALVGSLFAFMVNAMAQLSRTFSWYDEGALLIQLVILGGMFVFCLLAAWTKFRGIFNVIVVSLFLVNCISEVLPHGQQTAESSRPITEDPIFVKAKNETPVNKPNLYLLVYDAYVNSETMTAYGIDNSAQEAFLQQNGFKLYPGTYSIGADSIGSMSRVLNASTEFFGNSRRAVAGDGVVQEVFREQGYETYGIFQNAFFFRGIDSYYDKSLPAEDEATSATIIPAILMGEFRFDFEFNQMSLQEFVQAKDGIFNSMTGRRFVYMHTYMPSHSQNSGACMVNETELYEERLRSANEEMQQDVDYIIAKDPAAIIIIAGDHGPYLTKNCTATGDVYDMSDISRLDIQDRYGTFLAIRWPDDTYEEYDNITVLQDIFPSIFAFMYEDKRFLELKPDPDTLESTIISGVEVRDGIIYGGINNGEPLFINSGE
jgi:hypothetical protein